MESNMPFIPESLYKRLPLPLKKVCESFEDWRERDVFLVSVLGVLSGCIDNVTGTYSGDRIHANLFIFIAAPAASGKGSMVWAKSLVGPLDKALRALPINGEDRILILPANNSAANLIGQLNQNGGRGIMIETEADTLGNNIRQDWGNFSDLLRKAFHHEPVSLARKTKKELVEIDNPRLSIVLTGTPGQVVGIIPSAENGLFSRFAFYHFQEMARWRDVSPSAQRGDRAALFEKTGTWFAKEILQFAQRPVKFSFTESQWAVLNINYSHLLKQTQAELSPDVQGAVKRSGLIVFRLAMILSAVRRLQHEHRWAEDIECNEADFRSAIELGEVLFQHSVNIFDLLPKKELAGLKPEHRKFYGILPDGVLFSRAEAVKLGETIGIAERTADKYLENLYRVGYLVKEKLQGESRKYRKS
ncbi:hypothetical protein GCM10027299_58580 [Larkinella ripae]